MDILRSAQRMQIQSGRERVWTTPVPNSALGIAVIDRDRLSAKSSPILQKFYMLQQICKTLNNFIWN
ncbi:hypothetical protein FGIG_05288 [Fasciola gigantica]|uniref:Uncharacterized protein n=1 Tax=Fasciola gigantica TaxID=46835 RepID=A0A504YN53_FASGI|nr:hypothetical protein FGIG_05288 [Fasciola gigantica]